MPFDISEEHNICSPWQMTLSSNITESSILIIFLEKKASRFEKYTESDQKKKSLPAEDNWINKKYEESLRLNKI